ncbi:hypothetical protein [Spirillospora sp. CA-294931]|uniref:hypothetical protein n=1 Tax=Spirillospora sp. CA-294931 TaxID=3240042 RepID=UPI003D92B740
MAYPGDQGRPGGPPPGRPPAPAPYGDDQNEPPFRPYDSNEAPFGTYDDTSNGPPPSAFGAPQDQQQFGAQQFGEQQQFGDQQFGDQQFGDGHDQRFGSPQGPMPGGPPDPPSGGRARRNLPLIIGGAAVAGVLLLGAGFGVSSLLKDDKPKGKPKKPAPSAAPESPNSASTPPLVLNPVRLKSRQTDPSPLTLPEVFGKRSFTASKTKYVRTGWNSVQRNCTPLVTGPKLPTLVKKAGCNQVLRATYARGDGKLIGTIGILNLGTEKAAQATEKAAAPQSSSLKPLPGAGTTKKIGTGEALGTSQAWGHYLVMTWIQRPDGKKIPAGSHAVVQAFREDVIKHSNLGVALRYRETEGKPFRN